MKRSNLKIPSYPGFSIANKIVILIALGCFLVFFGLIHTGKAYDPNNPQGEHPWDELKSGAERQPPKPSYQVIILPCGYFGGWIIIHPTQGNDGHVEKDRAQIHSSDMKRAQHILLF